MDLCIFCTFPVRARQEGLQCDDCQQWQHQTCQTGITQQEYRVAVQTGQPIDWRCAPCSVNPLESTRLEDDLNSTVFDPPEFDPPASPADFNVDATLESSGLPLPSADESSITEPAPQPHEDSFHLEFEIVDDSTKRGKQVSVAKLD